MTGVHVLACEGAAWRWPVSVILTKVRIQGPERRAAWRRGRTLVGTTARGAFKRRAQITFISA